MNDTLSGHKVGKGMLVFCKYAVEKLDVDCGSGYSEM